MRKKKEKKKGSYTNSGESEMSRKKIKRGFIVGNMKRILFISQALNQSYFDMVCDALGEDVMIDLITGSQIKPKHKNIKVLSSPAHNPMSLKSRLICWKSHFLYVLKFVKNNKKKYDLIFATSNPPINSYIGLLLKRKYKCPFIYMNWDIYPQVIRKTISNPLTNFICMLWSKWNRLNYPHIDRIITLGNIMAENIRHDNKKVKVTVIPLPVDTDLLRPLKKNENQFAINQQLDNKFVVLYSGKMGRGHNIEIILEAAKSLKGNDDIKFVFIGNGEKEALVKEFLKNENINNVLLLPLQSEEIFPLSMAVGDIGIVSLDKKTSKLSVPSKIYSMMACGEAIVGISSGKDDLSELITSNRIGEVVTGENPEMLAGVIEKLYYNTNLLNDYKNNSRKTVIQFGIDKIIERYKKLFEEVLDEKA